MIAQIPTSDAGATPVWKSVFWYWTLGMVMVRPLLRRIARHDGRRVSNAHGSGEHRHKESEAEAELFAEGRLLRGTRPGRIAPFDDVGEARRRARLGIDGVVNPLNRELDERFDELDRTLVVLGMLRVHGPHGASRRVLPPQERSDARVHAREVHRGIARETSRGKSLRLPRRCVELARNEDHAIRAAGPRVVLAVARLPAQVDRGCLPSDAEVLPHASDKPGDPRAIGHHATAAAKAWSPARSSTRATIGGITPGSGSTGRRGSFAFPK